MSTNASISKVNSDKTVSTVYLHWDGYREHAGRILNAFYTTEGKVDELISYGNISELHETVEDCVFYGMHLREDDMGPRIYPTIKSALTTDGREYNYIFKEGKWKCRRVFKKSLP